MGTVTAVLDRVNRRFGWEYDQETLRGIVLVLPVVILILTTLIYPFLSAVRLSFFDLSTGQFVALEHYEWLVTLDRFWGYTYKSVIWTVANMGLQGGVGLLIALLINKKFKGRGVVRTVMLLPFVIPTVVTAITWRWLFNGTYGPINQWLTDFGLLAESVNPLSVTSLAMPFVILINTWRWAPLVALVVFAVLQTIPEEQYEAARVEGANLLQEFYHVTWPHLQSSLMVLGLLGFLLTFNIFDMIWLLTQGGPVNETVTLPIYIYEVAFNQQNIARGTAISVVLFLMLVAFVVIYFRQEQFEESEFV